MLTARRIGAVHRSLENRNSIADDIENSHGTVNPGGHKGDITNENRQILSFTDRHEAFWEK